MFEKLDEEWTKRYAQISVVTGGRSKEHETEGRDQIRVHPGTLTEPQVRTKPGLDPAGRIPDPEDPRKETRSRTEDMALRGCCSVCERLKQKCPRPKGLFNLVITKACLFSLLFAVVWSITGSQCLPGGNLFGLVILFICAVLGGKLVGLVQFPTLPPLPPLLGMLLAGLLLRNIPLVSDSIHIDVVWSSSLRNIALAIILTRAGLGLNPQALVRLKAVCVRLAVGPCLVEAGLVALVSHFLLKLPWVWGFILGFVLAAVSPAVVVPSMLLLQRDGYGVEKGIPTLLMAAGSFDDILAITGFSTCLGIAFSTGSTWMNVLKGLLEVVGGIVAGLVVGLFLCLFPSSDQEDLTWTRSLLLLGFSVFSVFLSHVVGFAGAGGLCVLVLAFCAALGWTVHKAPVAQAVGRAWDVFQPLLFGLIGAEISISSLNPSTVGLGVACLSLGVLVRVLVTFCLVHFGGFNLKEKLFIALAWLPKATVQAAIGSKALDLARETGDQVLVKYGLDVLTLAVLAILITAPIGALGIGLTGPRLLQRRPDGPEEAPPSDSSVVLEKDPPLESKL